MTYLTGLSVTVRSVFMMLSWSISNLSSTRITPSFVINTVVLPGTKSLWMTYMSSLILTSDSFAGSLPNCACAHGIANQPSTSTLKVERIGLCML